MQDRGAVTMRRRRFGLCYYRQPKGGRFAGMVVVTLPDRHFWVYKSVRDMLADSYLIEKYCSQSTLKSFGHP